MNYRTLVLNHLCRNIPLKLTSVLEQVLQRSWTQDDLTTLKQQISLEKVIVQAYQNAQALHTQMPNPVSAYLRDALKEEYTRRALFSTRVMPLVRTEATHTLEQAGVRFLFIKGSSITAYPHGYIRQLNDLDLMVESWDALFVAGRALMDEGYGYDQTPWEQPWIARIGCSGPPTQQMSGHLNLARREGEHFVNFDIHTSPFLSGPISPLISEIWQRSENHQPSIEDKLLILIAHAVNHGYFLRKDFNDTYAFLHTPTADFDWDYVVHCIQLSNVSYAALYLFQVLWRDYAMDLIPEPIMARLSERTGPVRSALISTTSRVSKSWRPLSESLVNTLQTLADEARQHGMLASLVHSSAYLDWRLRHFILQDGLGTTIGNHDLTWRILHRPVHLLPTPPRGCQIQIVAATQVIDEDDIMDIGDRLAACLRLSPGELQEIADREPRAAGLEVFPFGSVTAILRFGRAEALFTHIDLFVCTYDAIFPPEECEAIASLVHAVLACGEHSAVQTA